MYFVLAIYKKTISISTLIEVFCEIMPGIILKSKLADDQTVENALL